MVLDAVSNFVRGSTDASVDSTQTSVSVADASIFPDPATDGEYNVVIWDVDSFPRPDQDPDVEILRVTAIDTGTNTLTVTRGQETTSGASHPSGSAVHLSPTAKMFGDIEQTFNDFWDDANSELTADVNNTNVTTQTANIEQLSIGGYQRDDLLFDDSDSDTGTALSFDTGTIESCHTVGVKFTVYGHGAGNSSSIDVTVNNNTTTDYQWSEIDGSTLSNPSGESAWQFGQFDQSGHTWTFDLSASGGGAAGTDIPTLTGPVGAVAHGQLVGGTLPTVDVETINSVQVSTNFNATGDIRVYGGETA